MSSQRSSRNSELRLWRRAKSRPSDGAGLRDRKAQAMNDLANGVIDGNEALGVQLAEGHMNGPLSRSGLPQAVEGEIGALTEAHAGVADEQEGIAGYIVATQEFLLNEAILFETQRAWQAVIAFGLGTSSGANRRNKAGSSWSQASSSSRRRSVMMCKERVGRAMAGYCKTSQLSKPRMCGSRRNCGRVTTSG